jgi:competence protein ComEA
VSVAAAAAVVATVVVVPFGRPPPLEDRLPVADPAAAAGDPSVAGDEGGAEAPSGAAAASPEERSGETGDDADAAAGGPVVVHVAGAVTSPGVVTLEPGSRVVDAVTAAGGMRPDADPDRVNLAAPLTDGQRVVVPVMGQPVPAEATPTPASGAPAGGSAGGGAVPAGSPDGVAVAPVDLNSATAEQLDTLPGVGPATAAAIIEHRASAGPFRSIDSLLEVRGIGEAKLEAIRELVTVGG